MRDKVLEQAREIKKYWTKSHDDYVTDQGFFDGVVDILNKNQVEQTCKGCRFSIGSSAPKFSCAKGVSVEGGKPIGVFGCNKWEKRKKEYTDSEKIAAIEKMLEANLSGGVPLRDGYLDTMGKILDGNSPYLEASDG